MNLYKGDPAAGRCYLKVDPAEIRPGVVFDTEFEERCTALGEVEEDGSFDGYDSEGVVCSFGILMVVRTHGTTD